MKGCCAKNGWTEGEQGETKQAIQNLLYDAKEKVMVTITRVLAVEVTRSGGILN